MYRPYITVPACFFYHHVTNQSGSRTALLNHTPRTAHPQLLLSQPQIPIGGGQYERSSTALSQPTRVEPLPSQMTNPNDLRSRATSTSACSPDTPSSLVSWCQAATSMHNRTKTLLDYPACDSSADEAVTWGPVLVLSTSRSPTATLWDGPKELYPGRAL